MPMGDPVYPYENYPASTASPDHQLPEHSPVRNAAETVGNAVGSAVSTVRDLPGRLHLPERLQEMKQRFTVIRGRAQENALDKANELKNKAGDTLADARIRANRIAREKPLAVIAAAAGVAFLLGVLLRNWRDHD